MGEIYNIAKRPTAKGQFYASTVNHEDRQLTLSVCIKYGLLGLYLKQQNGNIIFVFDLRAKIFLRSAVLPPTYWMSNMRKAATANASYTA